MSRDLAPRAQSTTRPKLLRGLAQNLMPGLVLIMLQSLLLNLSSCAGYRFAAGADAPEEIKTLSVGVFLDRTAEGGLGARVSEALRDKLRAQNPGLLAGLGQQAKARVIGRIERVSQATVPMGRGGGVVAGLYRAELLASAKIVSRNGALIRDLGKFKEAAEFPVESGIQASESSRRRALLLAAKALGRRIAASILHDN